MNRKYAFILGNNAPLSMTELYEVLKREKISFRFLDISREVLFLQCQDINPNLIEGLGGTIKIVEVFQDSQTDDIPALINPILEKILETSTKEGSKYHIGISVYDLNANKKTLIRAAKSIGFLSINLKKTLKKKGINLSFLRIKERFLSSASALKNKLVQENGAEICLIVTGKAILIGKTFAVQNIDLYTKLDVGRPERDMISGTTPPKLAKIMINLAGKDKSLTLADPFCGSGTFIQEMVLLGYKNIYASDISEKAIRDTEENLRWLKEKVVNEDIPVEVFQADVRKLSDRIKKPKIDAIVSETYLGPPLTHEPTKEKISQISQELSTLFIESIEELRKVTTDDTRMIMAIPIFNIRGKKIFLPIEKELKKSGYKIVNLLPDERTINPNQFSYRNTFIYSRADQIVFREILVLEKDVS